MGLSAKYSRISSIPPYPYITSSLRGEFHWQASQKNPQIPNTGVAERILPQGANSFLWAGADKSIKRPKKQFCAECFWYMIPGWSRGKLQSISEGLLMFLYLHKHFLRGKWRQQLTGNRGGTMYLTDACKGARSCLSEIYKEKILHHN